MYSYTRTGLGAAPKVSRDEAKRVVQGLYLEFFLRDPWNPYDAGAEGYVNCLVEGWCDTDFVRTELLKSNEYRDKELSRAAKVYASTAAPPGAPGSSLVPGSGGASFGAPGYAPADGGGGIMSMTVAGIPVLYLAGGLVLLMMLKKR